MRLYIVVVACGLAAACSSFHGDESSADSSSGGSSTDGDGGDVVTGDPQDLSLSVAPPADVQIVQGRAKALPINVTLGKQLNGSVTIDVIGLPNGVTATPLMFDGTSGVLTLQALATAKQGTTSVVVNARVGTSKAQAPLKILVRGAPGDADTTWGKSGQVSVVTEGDQSGTADLVLGPNDDVYSVSGGPTACHAAHLDKNGVLDPLYGTNGIYAFLCRFPRAAALAADGQLVLVGGAQDVTTGFPNYYAFYAKLKVDGSGYDYHEYPQVPGTGFGPSYGAYAVAARADGDSFFASDEVNSPGAVGQPTKWYSDSSHFSATGAPASGYGSGGSERGAAGQPVAMFLQAGSPAPLVVVSIDYPNGNLVYAKYDSNTGAVLPGFESAKTVHQPGALRPTAGAQGAAVLSDGSMVIPLNPNAEEAVYLVKLDSNGVLDNGFGSAGVAGPYAIAINGKATGITADGDGKFLVSFDTGGVARFTSTGAPDNEFATQGFLALAVGPSLHRKVIVQKSGRILVTGPGASASEVLVSAYWP